MRPAAKSPHVVLDLNPPFPTECLAASPSPVPVADARGGICGTP
jgi:hypothetical protein